MSVSVSVSMGRTRRDQNEMRLLLGTNRVQLILRVQAGVDDATGLSIDSLMRSAHAKWAVLLRCSVPACRCDRSCSRGNDAATCSAVAVLLVQPGQASPEGTPVQRRLQEIGGIAPLGFGQYGEL